MVTKEWKSTQCLDKQCDGVDEIRMKMSSPHGNRLRVETLTRPITMAGKFPVSDRNDEYSVVSIR